MLISISMLGVGFILLVKGADLLIRGASAAAKSLGVSGLLIGLTVVAFGTSMPEFVVNVAASIRGTTDIAIGNIVGSNIVNIGLILGISAALFPLAVQRSTVWKEIPLALLAAGLVFFMAADVLLNGASADTIGRGDGFVLLSIFAIFCYYIVRMAKNDGNTLTPEPSDMSRSRMGASIVLGVGALMIGGKIVVDGAVTLASEAGIPERIIGLTIVAIGTSLPELVTSVAAAYRRHADLSVGNIIGSNIMNVFLILGTSAVITPLPFPVAARPDVAALIVVTILLFSFMFIGRRHVLERWQGISLVILYLGYTGFVVSRSIQ
jgi:cation:H+ antiporter